MVGLVANIRGSKGHNFFLDAARTVLVVAPETRFLIVGDGIGFEEMKTRVQRMGLQSSVHFSGFRRDVPQVMAALDVLVLPSTRSEGTSQVILQALAIGTPVVGSNVGGMGVTLAACVPCCSRFWSCSRCLRWPSPKP